MNRSSKKIITACLIILTAGGVVFKLMSNKKEVQAKVYHPDAERAVLVQTDTVKRSAFDLTSSFTGSFSPDREVIIGSEISGRVSAVNVEEGSHVKAGQSIAGLDTDLIRAQLASAEASYSRASNVLKRYQQAASGVTQLQIDNARTDVLTSKAQSDQMKKQLRQHTISSPFSGIITSRNFELGAIVSPGTQMASLIDISSVKLEVNVPEKSVGLFKPGQQIAVRTDVHPGISFQGKVDLIASNADASHNFKVRVVVPNPKSLLRSGMYGTISLSSTASLQALTIPRSSLIGSSVKPQVYVVENGAARIRDIQTGGGNETRIEVTSGLEEGIQVISGGLVNLSNGTKVSVIR